jgi:Haloacid dehalogenase-like hydrolase
MLLSPLTWGWEKCEHTTVASGIWQPAHSGREVGATRCHPVVPMAVSSLLLAARQSRSGPSACWCVQVLLASIRASSSSTSPGSVPPILQGTLGWSSRVWRASGWARIRSRRLTLQCTRTSRSAASASGRFSSRGNSLVRAMRSLTTAVTVTTFSPVGVCTRSEGANGHTGASVSCTAAYVIVNSSTTLDSLLAPVRPDTADRRTLPVERIGHRLPDGVAIHLDQRARVGIGGSRRLLVDPRVLASRTEATMRSDGTVIPTAPATPVTRITPPRQPPAAGPVVFDCDSVLLDTEAAWTRAYAILFARYRTPLRAQQRQALLGRSLETVGRLLEGFLRQPGHAEPLATEALRLARTELRHGTTPLPGAAELVSELRGRRPLAVASNATRHHLLGLLEPPDWPTPSR